MERALSSLQTAIVHCYHFKTDACSGKKVAGFKPVFLSVAYRCWDLVPDLSLVSCCRPERPSLTGRKSWSWRLSSWRWSSATRSKKTSRKPAGNPRKQVRAGVQRSPRPQGHCLAQVFVVLSGKGALLGLHVGNRIWLKCLILYPTFRPWVEWSNLAWPIVPNTSYISTKLHIQPSFCSPLQKCLVSFLLNLQLMFHLFRKR